MRTPAHRLGRVQLQIMQVLWRKQRATAREITDELSRTRPTAHSTVQTLLRELEAKGAVAHDVEDRTFIYRPLSQQSEVTVKATRDLLSRLFNGSAFNLAAHLLKHEALSPEDLDRLKRLIEEEKQA